MTGGDGLWEIRRIDRLGRVTLPGAGRERLGVGDRTPLAIYVDGDRIVLERYVPRCIFCGQAADLTFRGRLLCAACARALAARAHAPAAATQDA